MINVSVIIVGYKSEQWLDKCIASIRAQTLPGIEIIQIDNSNPSRFNNGMAANNEGAAIALGKYIYLLNPDSWLEPTCVERLFSACESSGADAAGGTLHHYSSDGLISRGHTGINIFNDPSNARDGEFFCIAGFWFIRRDVFLAVGGIDPEMFMYSEEIDISLRLHIAGLKLIQVPDAIAHHNHAPNRPTPAKRNIADRNKLLAILKNYSGPLLAMAIPCAMRILVERLALSILFRDVRFLTLQPFREIYRLRGHIAEQRRRINATRVRNDFWFIKFIHV